jgi:hypothetical protein
MTGRLTKIFICIITAACLSVSFKRYFGFDFSEWINLAIGINNVLLLWIFKDHME